MTISNTSADVIAATTVFIFAAGHGTRMLPLTRSTPKPLLKVGEYSLIEHHLKRLADQGFKHVVINVAYLAQQIIDSLGTGAAYGLEIEFSDESSSGALETAGGIKHALPLIRSDQFITINADIWTDYPFADLLALPPRPAWLVLVDNPAHNPYGDFAITGSDALSLKDPRLTFSGIARYEKSVFDRLDLGRQALGPVFKQLINSGDIFGQKYTGEWRDIGTPERLEALNREWRKGLK